MQNLYKVNKILYLILILINNYEFTCCIENSVDHDQLASSTLFTRELIFAAWLHTVFESVNCLSTERYKLICTIGRTSQIFFGQVHYGPLLVHGQVNFFTISTPLSNGIIKMTKMVICELFILIIA